MGSRLGRAWGCGLRPRQGPGPRTEGLCLRWWLHVSLPGAGAAQGPELGDGWLCRGPQVILSQNLLEHQGLLWHQLPPGVSVLGSQALCFPGPEETDLTASE